MHDSADFLGKLFIETYVKPGARVLEVGSQDINGTLRNYIPAHCDYVGADVEAGRNVDVVVTDPPRLPFDNQSFDVIVCSSCLEHDQMFWVTFSEMVRVLEEDGFIYINSPANGPYHRYPVDNWRFYPDAGLAFEAWSRFCGEPVVLVESFTSKRMSDKWNDCVMVFGKGKSDSFQERQKILDKIDDCFYEWRCDRTRVNIPLEQATEDMLLLEDALSRLQQREQEIEFLSNLLNDPQASSHDEELPKQDAATDAIHVDPAKADPADDRPVVESSAPVGTTGSVEEPEPGERLIKALNSLQAALAASDGVI